MWMLASAINVQCVIVSGIKKAKCDVLVALCRGVFDMVIFHPCVRQRDITV